MGRIRTLIVDDSALVRRAVTEGLSHEPDIEVVGTAIDPYVARDRIQQLNPDVITLDIEMPRMDGITFLKLIMRYRPMPVIIMSSLTTTGSERALEALQAGAVEVVAKPNGAFSAVEGRVLGEKIRAAAQSRLSRLPRPPGQTLFLSRQEAAQGQARTLMRDRHSAVDHVASAAPLTVVDRPPRRYSPRPLILIGASTGGTEAIRALLTPLPPDLPPILIVQHIPSHFSRAFADRLNQLSRLEVREATHGDRLFPGLALVAPGGLHLTVRWTIAGYVAELTEEPPLHHQRPAVDVLFAAAVKAGAAPHCLALVLTGMGCDGAAGLVRLRNNGATTVAQDEESCVVFGMPREAIRQGGAQEVLALQRMAARIDAYATLAAIK
jgi:two-component system chemotaxis response regulator CheB